MKFLLDTNAVIKMLYGNNLSTVLRAFYHHKLQFIYQEQVLSEYVEVAHRLKYSVPLERATSFFVLLQEYGFEITNLGPSPILIDRDDEIFVKVLHSPELFHQQVFFVSDNQKDFILVKDIQMIFYREFSEMVRAML